MQYTSLSINNFRGIKNLEINDLKRINVLTGRNNCGKTSILEAIFLLSGMSNPMLPIHIHSFRNLSITKDEELSYLFHDRDFNQKIKFNGIIGNNNRELIITPMALNTINNKINFDYKNITDEKPSSNINEIAKKLTTSNISTNNIEGINFEFKLNDYKYTGQLSFKNNKAVTDRTYKEDLECIFLNSQFIRFEITTRLDKVIVEKREKDIIRILKLIEPEIINISIGNNDMVYVDIGKNKLFPINIMGDGFIRILSILASIPSAENKVLLIDEVENGLHYASQVIAWKAYIEACKLYNVQLIATTHSYECIQSLVKAYDEIDSNSDDVRLFRIDRNENKHKAYKYNYKELKTGIEDYFEVR